MSVISLEPARKITPSHQNITAFQTCIIVFNVWTRHHAPSLKKCKETVRDLEIKNIHWRYNDETFCFLKQANALLLDPQRWELCFQCDPTHLTFTCTSPDRMLTLAQTRSEVSIPQLTNSSLSRVQRQLK